MKKNIALFVFFVTCYLVGFSQTNKNQRLTASYYHSKFNGRKTATGEIYQDRLLTAASNTFALGTRLLVTNIKTGKSVIVTINDRMATRIKGRVDLSKSAFEKIANVNYGIIPVQVEILTDKSIFTSDLMSITNQTSVVL
jgi:rare lipoprotein A